MSEWCILVVGMYSVLMFLGVVVDVSRTLPLCTSWKGRFWKARTEKETVPALNMHAQHMD